MYNSIAKFIGQTLKDEYGVNTEVALHPPVDALHGDLTTNVCMQVGKELHKAPREIAESLTKVLQGMEDIERVEVAGPGFLNITLTIAARLKLLLRVQVACEPMARRKEDPVIVEYSQPNIAKPLGVHHILSTVIGQSVANLHEHLGYNVIRINHLGDWGTQFGKLAVAMEKWGAGKETSAYTLDEMLDLYVRFHEEAEKDSTLEDAGREAFKKLEQGDPALRAFWADVVKVTMGAIEKLYDRLHVGFDHVHGESFYEDKMLPIIEEGRKNGIFTEGREGALIVEFGEETGLPPAIVMKGDGATIYLTRDLATVRYRVDTFHPQSIIYVVDVAQQLYFQQLFATVRKLGWNLPGLSHVVIGRMSFPDKSMSTRKGNIIQLEKALDEAVSRADKLIGEKESDVAGAERKDLAEMVGVGAFVYGVVSQNRKQNMIFTWDKALTFEGNSGPYIQYTHARARSVLRKADLKHLNLEGLTVSDLETRELLLMRRMIEFPAILEAARAEAMPHRLANYLYSLCQDFNSFYNALPILNAEEPARALRLALTGLSADILKCGAELLTLRVPDRM